MPKILGWIYAHRKRTGEWPSKFSGTVHGGYLGDNWRRIDNALKLGLRGLPGGDSLGKLLVEARGVRIKHYASDLTEPQILAWADRHHAATLEGGADGAGAGDSRFQGRFEPGPAARPRAAEKNEENG